eukprot:1712040-Pyramimonas_sp.AAC.1
MRSYCDKALGKNILLGLTSSTPLFGTPSASTARSRMGITWHRRQFDNYSWERVWRATWQLRTLSMTIPIR